MTQGFPHDETGELLRLMQEQGDDLAVPRDLDFFLLFETKDEALAFANQADLGPEFTVTTARYEKTSKWQVTLSVYMAPVYAEIAMLEKQVSRLAHDHGGQPDGWGCAKAAKGTGP